jgi:hypothetical protein
LMTGRIASNDDAVAFLGKKGLAAREYLAVYRSLTEKRPYRQWPQRRTDDAGGDGEYRERADQSLAQANLKRDGPVAA